MRFTLSCRHVLVKHVGQFSKGARKGMTMLSAAGKRGHDFWTPWIGVATLLGGAAIIANNASTRHAKYQAQRHEEDRARQAWHEENRAWHEEDQARHRARLEENQAWHDEYQQLLHRVETKVGKLVQGRE